MLDGELHLGHSDGVGIYIMLHREVKFRERYILGSSVEAIFAIIGDDTLKCSIFFQKLLENITS